MGSYLGAIEMSIKADLAYKADYLIALFFMFLQVLFLIFIWTAIYLGTKVSSIRGFTLPDIYLYFLVVYALRTLMDMNLSYKMEDLVFDGDIAVNYTRPVNFPLQLFFMGFGEDILGILLAGVPILIVALAISHAALSAFSVAAFVIEVLLAYAIISVIGFLIGMIALKFVYIASLIQMTWLIVLLLGGGVMPLNFFPATIQHMLLMLPFAIVLYVPAATFLGTISSSAILFSIGISAAWLVVLLGIAAVVWNRARRLIASARG
ncbi:MAG: ABC transporter permease [Candidatus Micrarchaeia archaeon]